VRDLKLKIVRKLTDIKILQILQILICNLYVIVEVRTCFKSLLATSSNNAVYFVEQAMLLKLKGWLRQPNFFFVDKKKLLTLKGWCETCKCVANGEGVKKM
jgi:hypothetical protein